MVSEGRSLLEAAVRAPVAEGADRPSDAGARTLLVHFCFHTTNTSSFRSKGYADLSVG